MPGDDVNMQAMHAHAFYADKLWRRVGKENRAEIHGTIIAVPDYYGYAR